MFMTMHLNLENHKLRRFEKIIAAQSTSAHASSEE